MQSSTPRLKIIWLIAVAITLAAPSIAFCQEDNAIDASPEGIEFFEQNVRPLLIQHCYECHSGDESNGGLLLDSRASWMRGGDSGKVVVPGEPEQSRLVDSVRYKNQDLQMPPSGRLANAEIATLEKWISLGAPDPRVDQLPAAEKPPVGMSIEDGLSFWSFQPIANPTVPNTNADSWIQTPVDAFILSRLQASQLTPSPPAGKRTLLRRASFDLIGLPPSPEEIDRFIADDSPDAFARVVERLLASPQYGQRWGRHWLDVARYADSNGLDENLAFGNAWRYRDYVVNAFNADKPFDQFLVEQLAGDLMPNSNQETKTATGFLALGAKVLAEPDREKLAMDTIDEQIDATGKAFLGMTLGCIRCHDHKFDPVKQTDYYALAAIFKSTKTFGDTKTGAIQHWYEHSFASDGDLESLKAIDTAIAAKKSEATKFKNNSMSRLRSEAVGKAAKYLAAASLFSPDASLGEVEVLAEPHGLHARILHHCRLHLKYNTDDPFVGEWHELLSLGAEQLQFEEHFQNLFDEADRLVANKNDDASDAPEAETIRRCEMATLSLADKSGLISVPPQVEHAFDTETLEDYYRLMEDARLLESSAQDEVAAMGVAEGSVFVSLPIHIRGSHRNLGEPVARGFPDVMCNSAVDPILPRNQSGRLELARWMARSSHPLTARVYVNRVWGWHFGRGIVSSTENFGQLGDRPTHPDLLDWLSRYFIESGWSTKQLHRLLLSSSVYQMASAHSVPDVALQVDPENDLLWRFRMQRLDAEQLRDSILAVSGRLVFSIGGKTVPLRNRQFVFNHTSVDHTKYDSLRRALYLPIIRNNLYALFTQFDFPDPTMPTGRRNETVVAPQALLLMNDPLVLESADALAERVIDGYSQDAQRIEYAYALTFARSPNAAEIERAIAFLADVGKTGGRDRDSKKQAWSMFCQGLLASNEFIYIR